MLKFTFEELKLEQNVARQSKWKLNTEMLEKWKPSPSLKNS